MKTTYRLTFCLIVACFLVSACAEQSDDLRQKVAQLEKQLAEQKQEFADFAGNFAQPKDFSSDIQRIEEQQERVSRFVDEKVGPIDSKLEEFRNWVQEAQKDREAKGQALKELNEKVAALSKQTSTDKSTKRIRSALASLSTKIKANTERLEKLSGDLLTLRKEVLEQNTKIVNAVKKALPKVKNAAVAEMKPMIEPLEKEISSLKTDGTGRPSPASAQAVDEALLKNVRAMRTRILELEKILESQKSMMLEMGSKIHELEGEIKRVY